MLRKISLAGILLLLTFLGGVAYLAHHVNRFTSKLEREYEASREKLAPRILNGKLSLSKRTLYKADDTRQIWQILVGWPADREGATIAVTSDNGAHFLDDNGHEKKTTTFSENPIGPIEIIPVGGDGDYGFLTRDQSWAGPVILFGRDGQKRWSYPTTMFNSGIDDAIALNDGGAFGIVVGLNGRGGIIFLDGTGKELWREPDANVWRVETLDIHGDGHSQILHTNARREFVVRSSTGRVIERYSPGFSAAKFSLTRWGDERSPSHILVATDAANGRDCTPSFVVTDNATNIVALFDAPLSNLLWNVRGVPVRLGRQGNYYAALQTKLFLDRSMLFLYDKDNRLVYQEIIGQSCSGIVTKGTKENENLLIGCANTVFEYSPQVDSSKNQP